MLSAHVLNPGLHIAKDMLLTVTPALSAAGFLTAVCCSCLLSMMMSLRCCGADVVTFNVSDIASLALNKTPSSVGFELRASHPAWGIWSLRNGAAPADESLLRLGLTPTSLTVSWPPGNRSELPVSLLDGLWHRVHITLNNNSSTGGLSIVVDGTAMPPIPGWTSPTDFNATTPLTLFATFGGVNGTAGLRGCLANASLNGDLNSLLRMSGSDPASGRNFTRTRTSGCQEDPCPCLNSGRCPNTRQWNIHAGCDCTGSGFLGALCQSPHPCQPDPCNYPRGNCSVIGNPDAGNLTSWCTCLPGYLSPNCTSPEHQQQQQDTRIVVALVVGLMLLLVLGTAAGVGICVLRDRRKDTGVYKPSDRELGGNGAQSLSSVLHPPAEERLV